MAVIKRSLRGLVPYLGFLLTSGCALFPPQVEITGEALVVVGSDYISQNDLRVTVFDGMEMAVLLKKQGYNVRFLIDDGNFPDYSLDSPVIQGKITTYRQQEFDTLIGAPQEATKSNVLLSIDQISQALSPGDNFVFFFAGHSANYGNTQSEDGLSESQDEILGLFNFEWSDSTTFITDNELADAFKNLPSGVQKMAIFDSCRSGGFMGLEGTLPTTGLTQDSGSVTLVPDWSTLFTGDDITPSNGLVLSAAPEGVDSNGDGDGGDSTVKYDIYNGYFTFTVLEGATSGLADKNKDGWITASEVYWYADQTIGRFTSQYRPRISGGPYDIILFKAP